MKRNITIFIFTILITFSAFWNVKTFAAEGTKDALPPATVEEMKCPDGMNWITGGCYIIEKSNKKIFVHTWRSLMQNKRAVWMYKDIESKDALEITKILRARLEKIDEIQWINISNKLVVINVYPLYDIPLDAIGKAFKVLLK